MAEEVDALLKDLRKKNSAKRREILLQEGGGGNPAPPRPNGKTKDAQGASDREKGLLKNLDKVLANKTGNKKRDFEEIASRINEKK